MKLHFKPAVLMSLGAVALGFSLLHLFADQTSLKLSPSPQAKPGQFTLKMQVKSSSNSVIYVIQTSTNLMNWETLVSGKTKPGAVIQVSDVSTTNRAKFFRVNELPPGVIDTNPPAWTNGVGAQFTLMPPSGVMVGWSAATDNIGVAQYSIFLNGVLITNVLGSTFSYQFSLNYQTPADVRIQASDASGNLSPILSLVYLPANEIAALSDDSGRVYVFKYLLTNSIQTNSGFTARQQIASFPANDRGLGLGDFDRDGILDLVAGYANGNTLVAYFFKGLGDGTFAAPVQLPDAAGAVENNYVMDVTVGDFDGDGNLDVVINGNYSYTVFYWGNGDGTFTPEVKNWADGNYFYGRGMAAGDFNEDGREDIARAANSSGAVKVFLSKGDRTFIETNVVATGLGDSDPYALAAGDFDEDGHLDLIVAGGGSGDVAFLKGFGDGTFTNITGTNGLWANLDIGTYGSWDAYDYNGDGHLDLVMAGYNGQGYFWPGNGDGTFSTNRVTIATGMSSALGATAPPRPPRVDVGISPGDPVTNLNSTIVFSAVGAGVTANDFFRWTFGDTGTNRVAWTFGAGTNNMGPTISHTYTNEGRFLTRLWHTTTNGINSVRGTWAIIKGAPPVANAGGPYVFGSQAATQGVWYATLDGSASTDDFGIVSYTWNFGDGASSTSTAPKASHGWPSNGVYAVSLTVFDAANLSSTNGTTITFTNGGPPVAVITGPTNIDETAAVNGTWTANFSGTSSTSPVGIWQYAWRNVKTGQTGASSTFQTTWTSVGTNLVTLMVTANDAQTNLTTFTVVVKANGLPIPVIQGPHLLSVDVATNGLWFGAWNATNSTDDTGIYIYSWNFGDGSTATGSQVSHNYAASGNYPLVLTVTDNGNQSVSATQNVIVVAGNPPVAKITASTLSPEGSQPITFSGDSSISDHGIYLYTWFLPPQQYDFVGQYLDPNQWVSTYAVQNNKLTISGQTAWGISYFFSFGTLLQRGCALQGTVDTPSAANSHTMAGLKNLNTTSGQYGQYPYAIYFADGAVLIYENGGSRGQVTNYLKGTAYDFRIETKTDAGARYYLRPSGTGQAFTLIFDSGNLTDASFSFGADVYAGVWSFEHFQVDHIVHSGSNFTAPVNPGGTVTLQVVDNALLTNSTSVVVTPLVGSPPVAGINGPTNGQSGVQLAFDGYSSSDDYAIASYTWNFGDGSPVVFGPAVSHSYGSAGVYTNTLTVMDYANQSSAASVVVTISGSNALVHVPWLIINGIEQPHVVYSGKTNTLKAVARGVPVPFTYIWTYGDGGGTFTNSVTTAAPIYNLEATHAYVGGDGTPYYAGIKLILTNGTIYQDMYPLLLQTKTIDLEEKVAIDEGLWHLQKTQTRYDIDTNTAGGYWSSSGTISATASSVQAFAVNGHLMTDDSTRDPYVDTVQRGINYLLNNLLTVQIGTQPYGNPDANNNGIGLQANSGQPIYETGPLVDALVAAARPELIAATGGANVKGRAYKDIVQDLCDMFAWGQYDDPAYGGGWRYGWNTFPDNSASQWGAIGLFAAQQFWGSTVPSWVVDRNLVWVNYSEGQGGFGYTGPGDGIATTPSALVQLAFDGITTTNALWKHGEDYLANNWASFMGQNNIYANYSMAKSMRTANPQPVHNFALTGKDWFLDPGNGLARVTIDHQANDGSWTSDIWVDQPIASAWSILILSSSLFQQGPVAVVTVKPNPSAIGYPVVFDGSGSYHKHPGYRITEWRWIFDSSKGADFSHPDAVGPIVTNVYGSFSTNTVLLQVRDNGTPQLVDVASVVVQTTVPPYPPTADAGGPYVACAGQDVHLDGSGSFCVDAAAGNFIQSYDWEVNYQVPVTFNQGVRGVYAVFTNGYSIAGNYTIGLRVKNANSLVYTNFALPDQTADAFTTVYVYNRVITDLKVRPKATKAQLTWTKAGDYAVIMRSQSGPDHGFVQVGQTTGSYATFLDTTIEYNTDYYYRIYAYRTGQNNPIGVSDAVFLHSVPRSFDARAPQFQSTPDRLAKVGQLYEVTLDAVDPQNQPIYFSKLIGPTNMTVNVTSGLVDFTPLASQVGNILLSFQVTNSVGRDVLSYTLFVFPATNHPPVAVVNGPYAALTGQNILFSSAGTSDLDNNTLRYYWNFGDGTTSTNPNPVHAYGGIGDYLVTLFVNDGYGGTDSAQTHAQITRPNIPPVAVVSNGPSFTIRLGETLTLNGSGSYSPLGNSLTYQWLWGDGIVSNNAPNNVSHFYGPGGPYSGSLVVTDNKGDSNTNNFNVTVGLSNRPPVIVFAVSSTNPYVESVVTFDASGSSDPEGDPMTITWDFGDHSKTTGSLVTHVFHQIQDFTVTLTVADNHGGSSVATQIIHALNAPPVFTSSPQLLTRAETNYTYTPTITDADNDTSTFQLVTGPATMSCDTNTGMLNWLPGTNNVGPNPIVLRATDANGASTDQSYTLVVSTPLGPQIDLQPIHIIMTNVMVDSQTLAYSGTVRVYLANNGSDPVPVPFTLSLFVDANYDGQFSTNDADYVVGYGLFPAGFPGNASGYVDMTVVGKAPFKDAPLYAFADSQGVVPEYNELNNIMRSGSDADTNIPPVIDLSASALQVGRFTLPTNAVLTARLGNSGLVSVPTNVPMAFYDGDPHGGGNLIGVARSTTALVPGQYQDLSVTWNSPTITNHTVFVVADDPGTGTNLFQEITLSNNTFSVAVDLAAVLPPFAYAGPNQNVNAGDTVSLNGRDSFDPQGRPLTYHWSMLSIPIGSHTQLLDTNTVSPSFVADAGGIYSAQLVVNDGIVDSTNPAIVYVGATDTNVFYPPKIISTPSFQAIAKVPYTYMVVATDPQNKPLTFRLPQGPAGMTINTNSGLVKWTPTNSGSALIQVAADGVGGSYYQGYTLTVIPFTNLPPQFTSTPVTTAAPSAPYNYQAVAVSPVSNSISYSLTTEPSGMSINGSSGVISWTPAANQSGGNAVTVTANDGHGGIATQSYIVVVLNSGSNGPVVQPIPGQTISAPATFATISLDNYVNDPIYADNQIVWTVTGTNLLSVNIDSNHVAKVLYPSGVNAAEQITFLATDPAGKSAYSTPTFTVIGNSTPPVAAIANLSDTDTTSIQSGSFNLIGTADDPGVPVPVAYRIGLYDSSGTRVVDLTPGPVDSGGWHEGRVAAGGSLGNLDFTMVRNGNYTLMLEVQANSQVATATADISLDCRLKLGQVTFSQSDFVLPIKGIGMQIIRTYDSLNLGTADFGYSWTYAVSDMGLSINEQRADSQDIFDETTFSLRTGGGRDVTLTMPDSGQRVTFRYSLIGGGLFQYQAVWTPPPGLNASLVPTSSSTLVQLFSLPPYWQAAGLDVDVDNFDFPGFILTTADGTRYQIDREDLGEHFLDGSDDGLGTFVHAYGDAYLSRITQPTGEHTDFVRNGAMLTDIQQFNSSNQKLRSILFKRDSQNRINTIYTPESLDTNGVPIGPAAMTYTYDTAGNLASASRLKDASNPSSLVFATTGYLYENTRFPHFITAIVNPQGIKTMRFEYDDFGRLTGTYDAAGHKHGIDYNPSGHTSTVFDAQGNATVLTFDDHGNVTAITDPLGNTSVKTFNANNQVTSITDPLGNTHTVTYDSSGAMTAMTDPLGNTTTFTMSSGQMVITDPLGRATTQTFNPAGKITSVTDAAGGVTSIGYDSNGNPNGIVNALGQQVANATFDSSGRYMGGSNYLGMVESENYDDSGNNTGTTVLWAGASGTNAAQPSTWSRSYDAAGNKLSDSTPDGKSVSYDYDIAGRRTGFTDSSGNRSSFLYNANGRTLEIDYPDGSLVRNVYDENNRVILTTDRALASQTPNGTRTVYDALGRTIRVERLSKVMVNVVTQQDLLSTTFVGSGAVMDFVETTYDADGRAISTANSAGRSNSMEYDADGRVTAIVQSDITFTNRTEYEYDAVGNKITIRDPLNRETHLIYDKLNRPIRTIFPDGSSTRVGYSLLGKQRTAVVDQVGSERDFGYDGLGHLTNVILSAVSDPLQGGATAQPSYQFTYDDFGHVTSAIDPLGHTNRFGYDDNERQTSHTMPGGQQESATYDSNDRVVTSTDFNGVTTEFKYDAYGRVTDKFLYNLSTHSATQHVQQVYDTLGRRDQLVEPRGTTSYSYDPVLGTPTQIASPEGVISYDYDPLTRALNAVRTGNTENQYAYDEDGRLTGVTVVKRQGQVLAHPETTTYEYNSLGLRTAVHLPNGTTTYVYDMLDRPTLMLNVDAASNFLSSFNYAYRANGTRSGAIEVLKDSSGVVFTNQFTYAYDALGRLTNEVAASTANSAGYNVNYLYDLSGNRLQRAVTVAGKSIRTTYAYDANNRLLWESNSVAIAGPGASGIPIQIKSLDGKWHVMVRPVPSAWNYYLVRSLPYALAVAFLVPVFLRRWRARSWKLKLDPRHSIWTASLTSYLVAAMVILPMDWRAAAAEADLFAALNTDTWGLNGSVTTYQYDANGSVTQKTITGGNPETVTYGYDFEKHLVTSSTSVIQGGHTNTTTMSYVYNDVGLRVSQSQQTFVDGVPGSKQDTIFVLDIFGPGVSEQVIEELPAVGSVPSKSYSYGIELLAQTSSTNPTDTQYLMADGHRSTRQVISAAGAVQACYSYDAYGMMLGGAPTPDSPALTSHLYCGEVYDLQQQQYYLRARYYDQSNGRFTSEDPYNGDYMNPQTTHKYQYCSDDPVNHIDPTGMQELMEVCVDLAIDATLMSIECSFAFKDILKKLSPIIPDSALLGVVATKKGFLGLPVLGLIAAGTSDPSADAQQYAQGIGGTAAATIGLGGPAAVQSLTSLSMLVVGFEAVFCMSSAQSAVFVYFGGQVGTPSDSISVYSAGVWNMWNEKDYTGYFAGFGGGAGNYGGGYFEDPTDGKPWGISFTFLSKSDSVGFGGGANVTYYYEIPGSEVNFSTQYAIIPIFTAQCALVSGVVSKNAGVALIGGILGIGVGFLWEAIKELPTTHGADSSDAAYQFYLNQRQTADRPDNWDTGDPEPDLSATH